MWLADKIVFLNDVYFCARDVIRLLLHNVDMACGMDFDRRKLDQVPTQVYTQLCARFQERLVATFLGFSSDHKSPPQMYISCKFSMVFY